MQIIQKPNPDADGFWLAGLVDGEGCFAFYVRRKRGKGYSFDFTFKVSLRDDDSKILNKLPAILGVTGTFSTTKRRRWAYYKGRRYRGKPLRSFRVYSKSEIARVIEFFRKYPLRTKKQRDFQLWAKAFEYYCNVISSQSVQHVRFCKIERPSFRARRPVAGTPRSKLRRTPPAMIRTMKSLASDLREGRRYRAIAA